MRRHTTNDPKGSKEVNYSDFDNDVDTIEDGEKIYKKEETHSENDEDVHDSVTAYLKEYRNKINESDKVSGILEIWLFKYIYIYIL